jgi:DNA-directed RNA polymerase subunit beta
MSNSRYFISDFVEIQRRSFFELLEKGIIDEFSKRNPITSIKKDVELYFYPEYYKLTLPEYNPRQAILRCKSYTSKLYMPVQLTYKKSNTIRLKWAYIGNLPLMTKRGHFILNGAARVIVNQIIRSPGIYYQEKLHETFSQKWSQKPEVSYKRYYADLICLRGTWLRLEIDKDKNIWAQTKKGPKIPVFWFLIAMGLSERVIFNSILEPNRLVQNLACSPALLGKGPAGDHTPKPPQGGAGGSQAAGDMEGVGGWDRLNFETIGHSKQKKNNYCYVKNPPSAWKEIYSLIAAKKTSNMQTYSEQGRKWLFNKFMNPRAYDLGKQGRSAFNRKLGLKIDENQLVLTPQDLLYATDYLIKVEKGLRSLDDIDHLKNRRVRTSGELIQMQIGIALVRLEKAIREKMNKTSMQFLVKIKKEGTPSNDRVLQTNVLLPAFGKLSVEAGPPKLVPLPLSTNKSVDFLTSTSDKLKHITSKGNNEIKILTISNLINNKAFNSALREFFGTSPLSQFMDQINPLAEITHKRRLSSMGPGGVTRDTATLAIRGIHPTHYGRICPVETPEGKNTGLVNSMTTYARVNPLGMLESPFYKVYKGIVQKTSGMFFLSAEQEENTKLAAADLLVTDIGFLPNTNIPVRIGENFTKIHRNNVEYIGVSPIQMISIATSLIPFLEHNDANRALMGSNMQRQAVPLIRPERPIVGTGLESRAVSDSGHVIQSKLSGVVTYVSAEKIIVTTLKN